MGVKSDSLAGTAGTIATAAHIAAQQGLDIDLSCSPLSGAVPQWPCFAINEWWDEGVAAMAWPSRITNGENSTDKATNIAKSLEMLTAWHMDFGDGSFN